MLFAGDVRLDNGQLWLGEHRFTLRGVNYGPADSLSPCLYARDLPLIAALGANTVRTSQLLDDGDTAFVPLLQTTGLHWLAGFPLEAFYDPARPISARKAEILEAFESYALRFRGEPRLVAYVFGDGVLENYNSRFSGPISDFYDLLAEAAALLQALEPEQTPLLATGVRDLARLRDNPPGLDFWVYDAGAVGNLSSALDEIRKSGSKPVLIGSYGVNGVDEETQALAALDLTREIEAERSLLGGLYAGFADDGASAQRPGIFRSIATGQPGFDTLRPRAVFQTLAGLWGGHTPSAWRLEDPPQVAGVTNAASGAEKTAPGALMRVVGEDFAVDQFGANGIPWPLHLGEFCLCLGDRPAPLAMVSAEAALAQVPWDLAPGDHTAVLYRAGVATNFIKAEVQRYAPGIFPGGAVRAGTYCSASAENSVRPGEILEVYATGLGPGTPSFVTPEAYINGTPAEVLYSGAMPTLVGLNQVNLRVSPMTPPSKSSNLELRIDNISSNLYPLSVADITDRPGVWLQTPPAELVLQAGGPGVVVEVGAEGANGYCGPVLLTTGESPSGVSIWSPVGFTGAKIPVEVRASLTASPRSKAALVLFGYAPGATTGTASLQVTVLPSRGDVKVRVISGGFASYPVARIDWNERPILSTSGGGAGRGINVVAVDAPTGVFSAGQNFDTWGDESAPARLIQYLAGLPDGALVLFAAADDGSLLLRPQDRDAIGVMFGSRSIRALAYQQSWAMIARKGAAAPLAEGVATQSQVVLERTLSFPLP